MTISERIKLIRGSLSQSDFGAQIGVSQSAVQNYESGQIPKGDVLQRIHQNFKVNINWLLTDEGNPSIEKERHGSFKTGGIELQDGEGLWGKTRHREVEGTHLTITEFKPKDGQAQGPLLAAITGLSEIFDSNDPILIPAIQANIRAFQLSARRERQNSQLAGQVKALQAEYKALQVECDELKKRIDTLEKTCAQTSTPGPEGGDINRKVM